MANEPELTWGLLNGELKHVSVVANGIECRCACAKCGGLLLAINNEKNIKEHHFRHYAETGCKGAAETVLHMLAKSIFLKTKTIRMPMTTWNKRLGKEVVFPLARIEQKVFLDDGSFFIPDAIGFIGRKKILIEFAVSHFVDENKKKKIKEYGHPCIEINLKGVAPNETSIYNALVSSSKFKYWILEPPMEEWREREIGDDMRRYNIQEANKMGRNDIVYYKNKFIYDNDNTELLNKEYLSHKYSKKSIPMEWILDCKLVSNKELGDDETIRDGFEFTSSMKSTKKFQRDAKEYFNLKMTALNTTIAIKDIANYKDRIGVLLMRMKIGDIFIISEHVRPSNYGDFLSVVKDYIDRGIGKQEAWAIELNGSLEDPNIPIPTKIRKISIKHEKQKHDVYNPSKISPARSGRKGVVQNRGTFNEAPEID